MPISPKPSNGAGAVNLAVVIPGSLKDAVLSAAQAEGLSLTQWVSRALKAAVEAPRAPVPVAPRPTVSDVIADYLAGRKTLAPCGQSWPCPGASDTEQVGGADWCRSCGICLG